VGPTCYSVFFVQGDLLNLQCIKLAISTALGYAIVAGGAVVKLPQIWKIVIARSTKGINESSVLLEIVGLIISLSFSNSKGFPFSTYGEAVFISIQDLVIFFLMNYYANRMGRFAVILALYVGVCSVLLGDLVSPQMFQVLQSLTIPLFVSSRVPQILQIYHDRSSGQLALSVYLMTFGGSLARIFTTLSQAPSMLLLVGYILGALMNGTIVAQILYYGNGNSARVKKRE